MIASFTHNLLFVKTRKVGGTSLEIVLSSWCSDRDIVTPIPPADEEIRASFGGAPRNFRGPAGGMRFYNHMPATDLRMALPQLWESAFKFSVDRHPYEKVVSRAFWNIGRRGGSPDQELAAEIDSTIASGSYLNYPLYCEDGKVIVDEVWRYEDMWTRLDALAQDLGEKVPAVQPRAKGNYRTNDSSPGELLSKSQRDRIAQDAAIEFDLFGYER